MEQGEEQKPDQAQADERDRRRSSRERLRRKYLDDIAAEKIALDRCAFDLD